MRHRKLRITPFKTQIMISFLIKKQIAGFSLYNLEIQLSNKTMDELIYSIENCREHRIHVISRVENIMFTYISL